MPDPAPAPLDVVIAGYGPTGAVLANLLGQAGLAVAVLEREREIHPSPRAAHFDGETMRVFQSIGLGERAAAVARPGTEGMHFVNAAGRTLLVRAGSDQPGPHGHADSWYFHQPELEGVLREGVHRFPSVRVALGHELCGIEPGPESVVLEVRADGRRTSDITARYLVGCDGARSYVREVIGSGAEDLGLHQPWLCLDLLMHRDVGLPEHTVQLCDPLRPMTIVNMTGRRRRFEIMLMPGDDAEDIVRPQRIWPLLARWLGPEDAEIERSAIYTFHSVIARGWRSQRLLIAGDAAHQTPPFLGQGMCTGIRDAANLAWKLALVLEGRAAPALLDSYASERAPHVRAFIELAVRVGRIIQMTDASGAEARDSDFAARGTEVFGFPRPQLGPGVHTGGAAPVGAVFPQPLLPDGARLDERLGGRFGVLAGAGLAGALRPIARQAQESLDAVTIAEPGPEVEGWLAAHGAGAVVLRPDRYVYGLARDAEGLEALLGSLAESLVGPAQ